MRNRVLPRLICRLSLVTGRAAGCAKRTRLLSSSAMRSQCPECYTVFRLTDDDLIAAGGDVRCGFCLAVYNAALDDSGHDQIHIDDLDFMEDDNVILGPVSDVVPPELRAPPVVPRHSMFSTLAWSMGIIVLINAFLFEYVWFHRSELARQDILRPWIERFCDTAGCDIANPRDPSSIEMISRNVYTHPNVDKALMVTATMTNEAVFEQDYPQVQVDFSNVRGEVVAARRFTAEEYLNIDADHLKKMQPGSQISFTLEIMDPGKEAVTYEFDFY